MSDKSQVVSNIIDNIRRVFQVVNEQSKRAERETGITGPQLWAIKTISQESPIMVSELAQRMYLHPATVVGILDRLEKQDLVTRVRSTVDRRVVRIELTERGQELVIKAPEVAQGLLVNGLEKLPGKKLLSIDHGLNTLVDILGAQRIPPRLILSPEVNKPKATIKKAGRSRASRLQNKG
jgi:MarR family transcriptional regulator, organic hydroperoxide resistance regulator